MIDLFGVRELGVLELADVAAVLQDAKAKPLHWEARGIKIEPGEVCKQICAFANSHDGGFLILGTDVRKGAWVLDGAEFPTNDPPAWVADVAEGVRPYPEGLEVRALAVGYRRWVAIVWVPPTPTPPCNAQDVVYERVSGKAIAVGDSVRLAGLFAAGDRARQDAQAKASLVAARVMGLGRTHVAYAVGHVQLALGISATGYRLDPSPRPFSARFEQGVITSIHTVLANDVAQARTDPMIGADVAPTDPIIVADVAQDSRSFEVRAPDMRLGFSWLVRATNDGAIGVYWTQGVERLSIENIVNGPLRQAWQAAEEVIDMLEPRGPRYLQVIVAGGSFPQNRASLEPFDGSPRHPPVVARGPLERGFSSTVLASIERELRRAAGEMAYEG